MVGVDLREEGKETISELLIETLLEEGGTTVGIPHSETIESKIWARGLYEGTFFDLITVGTKLRYLGNFSRQHSHKTINLSKVEI